MHRSRHDIHADPDNRYTRMTLDVYSRAVGLSRAREAELRADSIHLLRQIVSAGAAAFRLHPVRVRESERESERE
jgi:hypothetical protein